MDVEVNLFIQVPLPQKEVSRTKVVQWLKGMAQTGLILELKVKPPPGPHWLPKIAHLESTLPLLLVSDFHSAGK
jgi:hypothetical protein